MQIDTDKIPQKKFLEMFPGAKLLFEYFDGKALIEREIDSDNSTKEAREYFWITLETRFTRQYSIRINMCDDGSIYFGAWSTDRLMRPFEDWHRGNDLNDGKLCDETINRFLDRVIDDLFVDAPSKDDKKSNLHTGIEQEA